MLRVRALVLVLVAIVVVGPLAGCGGGDDSLSEKSLAPIDQLSAVQNKIALVEARLAATQRANARRRAAAAAAKRHPYTTPKVQPGLGSLNLYTNKLCIIRPRAPRGMTAQQFRGLYHLNLKVSTRCLNLRLR